MIATMTNPEIHESRRQLWLGWVDQLIQETKTWAEQEGWSVYLDSKTITEERLGTYPAPVLRIRTAQGELRVEPIALYLVGGEGRVDLEAWPSLNRVRLIRNKEQWEIITDSNVPLRQPWNRNTFVQLAKDLTESP